MVLRSTCLCSKFSHLARGLGYGSYHCDSQDFTSQTSYGKQKTNFLPMPRYEVNDDDDQGSLGGSRRSNSDSRASGFSKEKRMPRACFDSDCSSRYGSSRTRFLGTACFWTLLVPTTLFHSTNFGLFCETGEFTKMLFHSWKQFMDVQGRDM